MATTIEKIIITNKGLRLKLSCNSVYETAISSLGETLFLTEAEARAKLEELKMTTLKGLIEKFGNTLTDMQIIKEWFTRNNQEAEGLKLVSELAQSQLNKVERKYDYARTWIPVKVDMRNVCQDKDVGEKLNKLIDYQILGVPIPDNLLIWAKETIPAMKMPPLFFMDTVKWLDERFGIKFKGE